MKNKILGVIVICLIIININISYALDGQKIPLARVPIKVIDAVKKAVFAIDIKEIELVTGNDGSIIYEFEGIKDMKNYKIQVSADGQLIRCGLEKGFQKEEKNQNKLADLPDIICKTIKKVKPGILIHDFAAKIENGQLVYEVQGAVNFEKYKIEVSEKGQILEIEKQ